MKQPVRPQTFIVNQAMIIIKLHHALFMWNQSRWNIGGVRQRTQKERTRYCGLGREGENGASERTWRGFYIKDSYFWFWPIVLNQHEVFLDIATGHIHTEIFWDNVNSKINIRVIFRKGVYVQQVFWCYDFSSNNSEVRCIVKRTKVTAQFSKNL